MRLISVRTVQARDPNGEGEDTQIRVTLLFWPSELRGLWGKVGDALHGRPSPAEPRLVPTSTIHGEADMVVQDPDYGGYYAVAITCASGPFAPDDDVIDEARQALQRMPRGQSSDQQIELGGESWDVRSTWHAGPAPEAGGGVVG